MFRAIGGMFMALYHLTKIRMFSDLASTMYRMGRVGDAAGHVRSTQERSKRNRERKN